MVVTELPAQKGERLNLLFSPEGAAVDITGWALSFFVGRRAGLERVSTPAVTLSIATGGIIVTNAAAGLFAVTLDGATVKTTLGPGRWQWSLWRTDAGSEECLARGELPINWDARW